MQELRCIREWFEGLSPISRTILQNLIIWSVVAVLLIHVGWDLSPKSIVRALDHSHGAVFVSVSVAAVAIRWLADTYLFSLLFTYFHRRTSYREVLPASTVQYFLQTVNVLASDAALVVFLHRRKNVPWVAATWTLAYQGMIDAIVMSAAIVLAGLIVPASRIRIILPYAAMALVFFLGVAAWWMLGHSQSRLGRWLRSRPGLQTFRKARLHHYLILVGVRSAIFAVSGMLFYVELRTFGLQLPMNVVLALSPAMIVAQNAPLTPSGLGTLQLVMTWGLAKYAKHDAIVTAGLAISVVQLLCRIPLGIGAAGSFTREVLDIRNAGKPRSGALGRFS